MVKDDAYRRLIFNQLKTIDYFSNPEYQYLYDSFLIWIHEKIYVLQQCEHEEDIMMLAIYIAISIILILSPIPSMWKNFEHQKLLRDLRENYAHFVAIVALAVGKYFTFGCELIISIVDSITRLMWPIIKQLLTNSIRLFGVNDYVILPPNSKFGNSSFKRIKHCIKYILRRSQDIPYNISKLFNIKSMKLFAVTRNNIIRNMRKKRRIMLRKLFRKFPRFIFNISDFTRIDIMYADIEFSNQLPSNYLLCDTSLKINLSLHLQSSQYVCISFFNFTRQHVNEFFKRFMVKYKYETSSQKLATLKYRFNISQVMVYDGTDMDSCEINFCKNLVSIKKTQTRKREDYIYLDGVILYDSHGYPITESFYDAPVLQDCITNSKCDNKKQKLSFVEYMNNDLYKNEEYFNDYDDENYYDLLKFVQLYYI